jgi:hypothetical protein
MVSKKLVYGHTFVPYRQHLHTLYSMFMPVDLQFSATHYLSSKITINFFFCFVNTCFNNTNTKGLFC